MATIADFFIKFLKRPKFTFHPVYSLIYLQKMGKKVFKFNMYYLIFTI